MESTNHPYVPRDLVLPDFVPGQLSEVTILGVFGSCSVFVVSLIWIISDTCFFYPWFILYGSCNNYDIWFMPYLISGRIPKLSKIDRLLMCWWAFTGLTHIILEGYFAFSPEFYKEKTGFYLAEVWKEYSKGDSRYVGRDAGVVTVEGITAALEGPASLLTVYAIAKKTSYRHILQIAISLGQLYGTAVYFITSYLEGDNFAASTYHYYAYYVFANSFWVWIPTLIVIRSWKTICAAFQGEDQEIKKRKKR